MEKKKILCSLLLALTSLFIGPRAVAADFVVSTESSSSALTLVSSTIKTTLVWDAANDHEVVGTVAKAVAGDINLISGQEPDVVTSLDEAGTMPIIAGTIGRSTLIDALIGSGKLDATAITGKWEAYTLQVIDNPQTGITRALVIAGSTPRGTAYGLFELSRRMGVSPLVWWADVTPEPRGQLYVSGSLTVGEPSVKYRGIFINDEDWGMQPWAAANMDTDVKDIGPKTYARIFEGMLRMRANYLWPAMHPSTKAFWYYKQNPVMARQYDIVLGASHCEPLLRNNVDEWQNNYQEEYGEAPGAWNWKTNSAAITRYWTDRVIESKNNDAIYTIGMRGIHDSSMPGYSTNAEKQAALKEVIGVQRDILATNLEKNASEVPQVFCPYKEALTLYRLGLDLADDVTLLWADDNFGYVRQYSDADEQKRSGGGGVYYHFSYWGVPCDYLWLSTVSPTLTSYELTKAYDLNCKNVWIFNVGDLKPQEKEMQFALDFAWDVERWSPDKAHGYIEEWAAETFGDDLAQDIAAVQNEYYRLAAAGKPEHSHKINRTEAEMLQRLTDYDALEQEAIALQSRVPSRLQDAYFELIYYPVVACSQYNKKVYYAQLSFIAAERGEKMLMQSYATQAQQGYQTIVSLTTQYNSEIADGKWNKMMDYAPRGLAQFGAPTVATEDDIPADPIAATTAANIVTIAAKDYTASGNTSNLQTIDGLGISDAGVTVLPLNQTSYATSDVTSAPYVDYTIPVKGGANTITVKCLPDFPIDSSHNLRYATSINGGTPTVHSIKMEAEASPWSTNVMTGYSYGQDIYASSVDGEATLRVYLLDPAVVLSQIDVTLPDEQNEYTQKIVNPSFELKSEGVYNDGTTVRGYPYGWEHTGTLSGNSYGINNDGVNISGNNLCWLNSTPMPELFELYQTIEGLEAGTYVLTCKMAVPDDRLTNQCLFANNTLQYYGSESDYGTNIDTEATVSYAGYATTSNYQLRTLRVEFTLAEGEALRFGIRTSNVLADGTSATNNAGWLKIDDFQLDKLNDATPEEAFSGYTVSDEGAWCWFADPRALHYENAGGTINATYIGYIDIHGNVRATQMDWLTGQKTEVLVRSAYQPDDHNNPTFLVLPDERVMIFYTWHTAEPKIYYRVSKRPGDISELGDEHILTVTGNTTYPSPFILSDDPEHIYLCWRGINWHPTIARMTLPDSETDDVTVDFGPKQIVQSTGARPYAKYQSNGKDKIYLVYTTGHPDNESPNWIYFNVIDINEGNGPILRDVEGTQLSVIDEGVFNVSKTSSYKSSYPKTVVDTYESRDWVWQIAIDEQERPVIAMTRILNYKKNHEYWRARWTGSEWQLAKLSDAGHAFHQRWSTTEMCYSGGMAIDPENTSDFYLSIPTTNGAYDYEDGIYEIWKYTMDADGNVTATEAVTENSTKGNARPYVIPGSKNSPLRLAWMKGDYYYWFETYPTGIMADYELPTTEVNLQQGLLLTQDYDTKTFTTTTFLDLEADALSTFSVALNPVVSTLATASTLLQSDNLTLGITADGYLQFSIFNLQSSTSTSTSSCPYQTSDGWTANGNKPSTLGETNLVVTYDGSSLCLYRDGMLEIKTAAEGLTLSDAQVGGFRGQMTTAQLWNRALSQDEARAAATLNVVERDYVTDTYIQNADFEDEYSQWTDANVASDRAIYLPSGWSIDYSGNENDLSCLKDGDLWWSTVSGLYTAKVNDTQAYIMRYKWGSGQTMTLYQDVTLPAGTYVLSADLRATSGDGTTTLSFGDDAASVETTNGWTATKVKHRVSQPSTVRISWKTTHATNGTEYISAIDNVQLYVADDDDEDTVNDNLVYDGDWAITPANETSGTHDIVGWTPLSNMRLVLKDTSKYPGLNDASQKAAVFCWNGTYQYGTTSGYELHLKANTVYELSLKFSGWTGSVGKVQVSVLNGTDGLAQTDLGGASKGINSSGSLVSKRLLFKSGAGGNYTLSISANGNFVFTDVVLKRAEATDLTLSDTEAFSITTPAYVNVSYPRQLLAGWNTICLPFDCTADELGAAQAGAFTGTDAANASVLNFESVTDLTAGTPYIIYMEADGADELTFANRWIPATPTLTDVADAQNGAYTFRGLFAPVEKGSSTIAAGDYIIAADGFAKAAGGNASKAFRAYITGGNTGAEAKAHLTISLDGGTPTSIALIAPAKKTEPTGQEIYDLQGRRIAPSASSVSSASSVLPKGLYIINGKKTIIK